MAIASGHQVQIYCTVTLVHDQGPQSHGILKVLFSTFFKNCGWAVNWPLAKLTSGCE